MYPMLRPGDRLVIKPVAGQRIAPGDIVVRRNGDAAPIVHRLIRRLPQGLGVTKGDAAAAADSPPVALVGAVERVEAVVRNGQLIIFTTAAMRWENRWRAVFSRNGLSMAGIKQRFKRALIAGGRAGTGSTKSDLAKILDPDRTGTADNAPEFLPLDVLTSEGIVGLLYTATSQETEMRHPLEVRYLSAVAENLACIAFLEKLAVVLHREQLPVMTLKGASLLDRWYPGPGLRPMEDVDLMVRPEDRDRFARILTELDFKANRRRRGRFQNRGLTIDLHIHPLNTERIDNRHCLLPGGLRPIWRHSEPWRPGCNWIRRPADADNVLLLSLHLLKHYYARLIWLEDIRRMVHRCPEEFQTRLVRRADALGCKKPVAYSLYALETLYPNFSRANPWVPAWIRSLSPLEKAILLLCIADKPLALAAPILEILAVRGSRERRRLALETLFPRERVRQAEFGAIRPLQRAWFVPRRLIQTLNLLQQTLSTILRILFRALAHR
jgi:hypothetical protein